MSDKSGNKNVTILQVDKLSSAYDVIKNSILFDGTFDEVKKLVEAMTALKLAIDQVDELQKIIIELHENSKPKVEEVE